MLKLLAKNSPLAYYRLKGRTTLKDFKPVTIKKSAKQNRERQVLIGLVELYLKSGKPIGSNTLKDFGFEALSSATIRNYFAHLEEEGFLAQQHTSGGRIPTPKAFRFYAQEYVDEKSPEVQPREFKELRGQETHELAVYLEKAAEILSQLTQCAVFLSAPRFDHDYINEIKLVGIDATRALCVLVTNFGLIQTEVLHLDKKLSSFSLKRIEAYFQWRLQRMQAADISEEKKPENLSEEEERLAQQLYNEIMMRYIVSYSNFSDEDIYSTGFSRLLTHHDLQDTNVLTHCLSLFENVSALRLLLKECSKKESLRYWIGDDLHPFSKGPYESTVVAIPYYINKQCVGAVGLLGPVRLPYRQLFSLLRNFSESISEALTRSIYKFKITYRQPQAQPEVPNIQFESQRHLGHSRTILIEHK